MEYLRSAQSFIGVAPAPTPINPDADSDFVDFAGAPAPVPVPVVSSPADAAGAQPTNLITAEPDFVWYKVWERAKPSDFWLEAIVLPLMIVFVALHFWGTRTNKSKAKKWMAVHVPVLESEFALVGYWPNPKLTPYRQGIQEDGLLEAGNELSGANLPDEYLKEKAAYEYQSYATGRQNVAFLDVKISLYKRYAPPMLLAEYLLSLFFESSFKAPSEKMDAVIYSFDGNEKNFVPPPVPGADKPKAVNNSSYDGFVFAIVHKLSMRKLRDERYDVSLTFTKEHAKLPNWATVMSESAEVTETMLTKDLITAVEQAGDAFEYLIVTDQPIDKPMKLDETTPKKRIHLSLKLPTSGNYMPTLPIFLAFLQLPDYLAQSAHFRPEVKKKINATREAEQLKLKRVSEAEAEEDRLTQKEKLKKEEKDRKLKGMNAEEQRKFLEKDAERVRKKQEKKMSRKG